MNTDMLAPRQDAHERPSIVIDLGDGQIEYRHRNLAGCAVPKLISEQTLREIATGIPFDSGWLTPNLAAGGVVRCGSVRGDDWVCMFFPPGAHRLEVTAGTPGVDETFERLLVPLPGLAFFGVGVRYWVWAVKADVLQPHHTVFRCPLPNVYQDGSVCWGSLKPPLASPRSVFRAWEMFAGSTFNNHLAGGKSSAHRDDVRDQLRAVAAGAGGYPVEDLLRQTEDGASLDKLLRLFFETGEMPG